MPRRVWRWLVEFWDDVRESMDASLLGIARFFGLLYGPIDRSLRIDQALKKALGYRLAPHVTWRHALGGITYLLLMVLVVTGVLLAFYYRPSAQEAHASIRYIVSEAPFGWLWRDLHVWAASLIVVVLLAHMARVFFAAAYKPPRETNWLLGFGLLVVVLAFGASGYLLPWDQWAYWTVSEGLDVVGRVPLLGWLTDLVKGDDLVSGATLSRYFAIHVILLPWLLFALIGLHFTLVRRHGVAPPVEPGAGMKTGEPFYPNHLMRLLMVAAVVLAVAISAAALWPRPVGPVADPASPPAALVSTWVAVDVWRALAHFTGAIGIVLFGVLGLAMAVLPLFDRSPERRLRHRPVAAALGITFFVVIVVAWGVGRWLGVGP